MLKFKVDTIDGLEEPLKPLYVLNEDDKKYYLQVEGVVAKEKLEEFRNNNIELSKKLDSYKDVDPAKYKELLKMESDGKFSGKTNEQIDQIISERVGSMKTDYETQIADKDKTIAVQGSQLNLLLVDNVVRDAANKGGVTGAAVDDILLRAKSIFRLVDGKPVPHDERGNIIYGNDGTTSLSVNAWVQGLKKTAQHLFPVSQGGGSQGGRQGPANRENLTSLEKISTALAEKS